MSKDHNTNDFDHENPEEIIDDIVSAYEDIQATFLEGAMLAGQEKERYESIKPAWEELSKTITTDPNIAQVYASGIFALEAYRNQVNEFKENVP